MVDKILPTYHSPRISSELLDCSSPLTFDIYSKCSMSCRYCFSAQQKSIHPGLKEAPLQAVHPDKFVNAMEGRLASKGWKAFYKHFFSKKFLLHLGGLADSFCHYERKYGYSYPIIEYILENKYPLMFSSKGPAVTDDNFIQLFQKYKKNNTVAFQFSIVTADDKLAKQVEPGVPSPTERFANMKVLSDMGYWCILRLRPFMIGITDETLPELLQKAKDAGAKAVSTEFFALDVRCTGGLKGSVSKIGRMMGIDNIFDHFRNLSPGERGGYERLNRLVKEQYVKYIYKFCIENNMVFACSDPDFKELCMTGNCCSLPPKGHHPTKTVNNWSSRQLTDALFKARIHYHRTGECKELYFNDVYGKKDWIFGVGQELSHQDINCTSFPYAVRKQLTLMDLMQERWNRKGGNQNPTNYLNGKVLPIGVDSNDNFIFKYNPLEYEKRWVDEGIDLGYDWGDHNKRYFKEKKCGV